eukprot:gene9239-12351_t
MKKFAQLLELLALTPSRNRKVEALTQYFATTPDPDRGYALAILTGALTFKNVKPAVLREVVTREVDPHLFALSYDYVGDLSETIALMWPPPAGGGARVESLRLTDVVTTLANTGRTEAPGRVAGILDSLDETGRWAFLKLVTGGLRIGASARLAKTAAAQLGGRDPDEIELLWLGLAPPYD